MLDLARRAAAFSWYHRMELAPGVYTDGDYDMAPLLPAFGFPDDMRGLSVLDVGRASGFFSFEFERRGARVVATELPSYFDWDWTSGAEARMRATIGTASDDEVTDARLASAFYFAREVLGSRVEDKRINVYDLCPEAFDGRRFDLVFAGSLTSHLRDPIGALQRLRSVTAGTLILAAPSFDIPAVAHLPMLCLAAAGDAEGRSWWIANRRGIHDMLVTAGFAAASTGASFTLNNRRVAGLAVAHIVAHASA
jgi:SAM-dependent methyltransferase